MRPTTARRVCPIAVATVFTMAAPLRSQDGHPGRGEMRPGVTVYSVTGETAGDEFGKTFAVLGDVNGDGVRDFVTSGQGITDYEPRPFRAGHVDLISGRDGTRLRQWFGERQNEDIGTELAALPDIDGDGVFEIGSFDRRGRLTVLSPVTGETWFTIEQTELTLGRSGALAMEDHDDDGVGEFLLLDLFQQTNTGPREICLEPNAFCTMGEARLHSGRTGDVLWRYHGRSPEESIQSWGVVAGDFNADGFDDVLIPQWRTVTGTAARLFLLSGADGKLIETIDRGEGRVSWGFNLISLGDHDGNGFPELAISAPAWSTSENPLGQAGWVGVYRLPDFKLQWSVSGRHSVFPSGGDSGDLLGWHMSAAGDMDRDGSADLLIGTIRSSIERTRWGRIYLHSGLTGRLLMNFEGHHAVFADDFGGSPTDHFDQLAPFDDLDGDGRPEFLLGHWQGSAHANRLNVGEVRIVRYRPEGPRFLRADTNGDGRINVTDIVRLVRGMYTDTPLACAAAHDLNGDGLRTPNDALRLVFWYFYPSVNEEPPPPFPDCGRYAVLHRYYDLGCDDEGSCALDE